MICAISVSVFSYLCREKRIIVIKTERKQWETINKVTCAQQLECKTRQSFMSVFSLRARGIEEQVLDYGRCLRSVLPSPYITTQLDLLEAR